MNFIRNLYATILIAVFGAIILAGRTPGAVDAGTAGQDSARAFGWVFLVAAASLSVALIALLLMEEKPLQTDAEMDAPASRPAEPGPRTSASCSRQLIARTGECPCRPEPIGGI